MEIWWLEKGAEKLARLTGQFEATGCGHLKGTRRCLGEAISRVNVDSRAEGREMSPSQEEASSSWAAVGEVWGCCCDPGVGKRRLALDAAVRTKRKGKWWRKGDLGWQTGQRDWKEGRDPRDAKDLGPGIERMEGVMVNCTCQFIQATVPRYFVQH